MFNPNIRYDSYLKDLHLYENGRLNDIIYTNDPILYNKWSFSIEFERLGTSVLYREYDFSVWKGQKGPFFKSCYKLRQATGNLNGYEVDLQRGFYLALAADYPWIDAENQFKIFPTGILSNNICVKSCPQGFYYSFESLSCRRCLAGCSVCRGLEGQDSCEKCVAGFKKVKVAEHHTVDKKDIGRCIEDCQFGFYVKRFDGRCLECEKDCLRCRDRGSTEIFTQEDRFSPLSFCFECASTDEDGRVLFTDLETGTCTYSCDSSGYVQGLIKRVWDGAVEVKNTCERCFDINCHKCSTSLEGACLE